MIAAPALFSRRGVTPFAFFALLVTLVGSSACVEVAVGPTPYYVNGPTQPEPPQGDLPGGTALWVLVKQDGYSQVVAPDGTPVWVWSRSLVSLDEWNRIQEEQRRSGQEGDLSRQLVPPTGGAEADAAGAEDWNVQYSPPQRRRPATEDPWSDPPPSPQGSPPERPATGAPARDPK